jgi:chemotaxis methyl-accepting protein methylase
MDDYQFSQLLNRFELSREGYRKVRKGVKKRLARHMQRLGCRNLEVYFHILDSNPEVLKEVELLITVSISRFFRDHHLWRVLEEEIIPDIIRQNREEINVWSVGCAQGQEVYSFKILWNMLENKVDRLPWLQLWATDINPDYLSKAMEGIYIGSTLKGVSDEIKADYFHTSKDKSPYFIADYLKEGIKWEVYDPIRQPTPLKKFHLIFLRNNILTYYRQETKERTFFKVINSLAGGGFLIIGSHEKLPVQTRSLSQFKRYSYIFQKIYFDTP